MYIITSTVKYSFVLYTYEKSICEVKSLFTENMRNLNRKVYLFAIYIVNCTKVQFCNLQILKY